MYQGCHGVISATPTLVGELHGIQFLLNVWREVGQDQPLQGFHGKGSDTNGPVVVEFLRGGILGTGITVLRLGMMPVTTDSWNS